MAKPTLLTVDDDPEVLRAIQRDLRNHYGKEYRVLAAGAGAEALDLLRQLTLRNESAALLLADQRMPGMNGVEFLEQAREMFPDARRVLLTAYADTEAAIRAINTAQAHYYLTKPWTPPDERLYPVLDELLDDWQACYRPGWEGLRVLGSRWSPDAHRIKDFLARNQVPYQWFDMDVARDDPEVRRLLEAANGDPGTFPLVFFPDGTRMSSPTNAEVAERAGLKTQAQKEFYDFVVVGGGPAGLGAAVYAASEGLKTLLLEKEAVGGQAGTSSRIENYLGFPQGISGADLARRARDQALRFGTELLSQEAVGLRLDGPYRIVKLADGSEISCHALLVATGVSWRKLDAPGIDRLTGAGVYYGAANTEAAACKDEEVYIVGGANSAGQAAVHFANYARQVTMLVRADSLTKSMSQYLIDQIAGVPNIVVRTHTAIAEARGDANLECLVLRNVETGENETVPASSLFIFIGAEPFTEWLDGVVERDAKGFLLSGPDLYRDGKPPKGWKLDRQPYLLETSVPGIFVAGDVRHGSIKRVAAGVGTGAVAVQFVHQYLAEIR